MVASVGEQIEALESERARLERQLDLDENWRALVSAQESGADTESELPLRRSLAANPYYAARLKIVEAITILRRLGEGGSAKRSLNGLNGLNGHNGHHAAEEAGNGAGALLERTAVLGKGLGVPWFGELETSMREVEILAGQPIVAAEPAAGKSQVQDGPPDGIPVTELIAIRGITHDTAGRLAGLGVTRYEHVVSWTAADVQRVSEALGLGRAISKDNWIEQAALLARTRGERADVAATVVSSPIPLSAQAAQPAVAVAASGAEPQEYRADKSDASPGHEPAAQTAAQAVPAGTGATDAAQASAHAQDVVVQQASTPQEAIAPSSPAAPVAPEPGTPPVPGSNATPQPPMPAADAAPLDPRAWLAERRASRLPAAQPGHHETPPEPPQLPLQPPPRSQQSRPAAAATAGEPAFRMDRRILRSEVTRLAERAALSEPRPAEAPPASRSVASAKPAEPASARPEPRMMKSLRSRLLGATKQADANAAAGYLGSVEEASVEIVRPDTAPTAPRTTAATAGQRPAGPVKLDVDSAVARFLKTLRTRG